MTKNEMAESILESSSAKNVSENRFYKNVAKQSKNWIERAYNMVMFSVTKEEKQKNANFVMQYLR